MPATRNSYTFKEGLTMMAAKAIGVDPYLAAEAGENARAAINAIRNAAKTKQSKDRAEYIREAQNELALSARRSTQNLSTRYKPNCWHFRAGAGIPLWLTSSQARW